MAVVKKKVVLKTKSTGLWHGIDPAYYKPDVHGVTFSLLTKWADCRERARLHLQGWTPRRQGAAFGIIIHAALERMYLDLQMGKLKAMPQGPYLVKVLSKIEKEWRAENPQADVRTLQDLELAVAIAEVVMAEYCRYWKDDATKIEWKALEHQFMLPRMIQTNTGAHRIPVRGKMDGIFMQKTRRTKLFETKTKSRLGEAGESNLVDILPIEMQVNLYCNAVEDIEGKKPDAVLYNIIRRPGMQPKKGERIAQMQDRLRKDINKRPEYYFIRLRVQLDPTELDAERAEHTAKITDFVRWYHGEVGHYKNSDQCENKYGTCEFLAICGRKDFSGFYKRPTVFRELEDV